MSKTLDDIHDGSVAEEKAPITNDLREVAEHIKSMCYFLGVDMVGICEIPVYARSSHDLDGNRIEPYHKFAIVLVVDQGFETPETGSGEDRIGDAQRQRAELIGSTVSCVVADYICQLGWPAQAQTTTKSDVLHPPLTPEAGLDEFSRIGEKVLNPFLGLRFETSIITTDLPLQIDKLIDFGLQDFCNKCLKCANNEKGASFVLCMKMCPFNNEGLFTCPLAFWLAIKVPALRGLLAYLDERLEFGKRNVKNKWWWNHEHVDGKGLSL